MARKKKESKFVYRLFLPDRDDELVLESSKKISSYMLHSDPPALNALVKLQMRLEGDSKFFNGIFGNCPFDPRSPKIRGIVKQILITPNGEEFEMESTEFDISIEPSMAIFARTVSYILNCGAFRDSALDETDKFLKYNVLEVSKQFLSHKEDK